MAEALGYRRAYFYDSPALYPDVWGQLYRAADRTERIVLGPAVLVPSNRHLMTNAAAIAGLAGIVGSERVSVAVGSGRTARLGVGRRPLRWAEVREYVAGLRALLRGETIDWDGARIAMMHGDGYAAVRPVDLEVLVAAAGPKGVAVARELGDGVFGGATPVPGFARSPSLAWGTVLAEGESPDSERVLAGAGAAAAVFAGHYPIGSADPTSDDTELTRWRRAYADVPAGEQHIALHTGHLCFANDRDRPFVTGELVSRLELALDERGWWDKLDRLAAAGVTEVVFQPAGDIPDELTRFARMAERAADRPGTSGPSSCPQLSNLY
ncbi:LLM class flavin-dependent oxidoreductase [Pseudonocardia sp. EC080610-09]|uniref:LLM class flavin-dependent oxidoreductase n=1 Tax=Pseudonocardia sp. EC080610-09 TaxID=1688404 RepID=UPI001D042952|nr:LLM class flavin-dependent oxidoreductase [Pseudonocardia sp. EC080610-09]